MGPKRRAGNPTRRERLVDLRAKDRRIRATGNVTSWVTITVGLVSFAATLATYISTPTSLPTPSPVPTPSRVLPTPVSATPSPVPIPSPSPAAPIPVPVPPAAPIPVPVPPAAPIPVFSTPVYHLLYSSIAAFILLIIALSMVSLTIGVITWRTIRKRRTVGNVSNSYANSHVVTRFVDNLQNQRRSIQDGLRGTERKG
jgi:hypothetical protein